MEPTRFKQLIPKQKIQLRLADMAKQIAQDYQGERPLLIGILKGGFILLSDLCRALYEAGIEDIDIDFMGVASYGEGTESSRQPKLTLDTATEVKGRHVLIVEDIVDTGHSLKLIQETLQSRQPASLKTCVLLSKPSRREINVPVEYIGFEVEGWIEGYGLDKARGCPHVLEAVFD